MISTPQEIEQEAVAIASWITYNGKPFVLPTNDGGRVYLTVLSEKDYNTCIAPTHPVEEQKEEVE